MSQGPDENPPDAGHPGQPGPTPPTPPNYGQPAAGQQPPPPPPPYGQPQQQYGQPVAYIGQPVGVSPAAPYGVHPVTGIPYSDKSKIIAGLLQILLPFGIGRFYIGDTTTGVWQLVVTVLTCGIGSLWSVVDGVILLASDSKDVNGYMLRS